jgi:hypothetical protein
MHTVCKRLSEYEVKENKYVERWISEHLKVHDFNVSFIEVNLLRIISRKSSLLLFMVVFQW